MASGWQELAKRLERLGRMEASVGWHDTAKYPDGTPVALVATVHEYGSTKRGIPPRPFMRPTIAEKGKVWSQHAGQAFGAVLAGSMAPDAAFELLSGEAAGDVRMAISDMTSPELSPITQAIRAKQGYKPDKPLVRSGLMLATCTNEVYEK